jgi:hypothetical protein
MEQALSSRKSTPGPPKHPSVKAEIERPLSAQQLAGEGIVPLHPMTILRWAREGKIPHRRLSPRKIIFFVSEIQAWMLSGQYVYPRNVSYAAQPERTVA